MELAEVPWPDHLATWEWKQGEHVTLIGPTGCGKTTLAADIANRREFVLVLASKPRDPVIDTYKDRGYRITREWPVPNGRWILWPKNERHEDLPKQRDVFGRALASVYRAGGWCVVADETRYITDFLKLSRHVELLWLQGRALGVSTVALAQRPRHLPLAAYSQASHLYLWNVRDREDIRRLADISGPVDIRTLMAQVQRLGQHETIYVGANTGATYRTQAKPAGK
jgi:hypothetical protein